MNKYEAYLKQSNNTAEILIIAGVYPICFLLANWDRLVFKEIHHIADLDWVEDRMRDGYSRMIIDPHYWRAL